MRSKILVPICMIAVLLLLSGCIPGYSQYKNQKEAEAAAEEARQAAEEYTDQVAKQMEEMKKQAEQQTEQVPDTADTGDDLSDGDTQETGSGSGSDAESSSEETEEEEEEEQTDSLGRQYAEVSEDYVPNEIITYELTDAQLSAIKEKVTKGVKSSFLTSTYPTGINVGESYVFAFGMTNMGIEDREFRYEVKYRRAKDMNNNAIHDIDDETMAGWISANDYEDRMLESYEQVFLPVGVTPKEEIGEGMPTIAGTYYFLMEVFYKEGSRWKEYDSKEFSVKVK